MKKLFFALMAVAAVALTACEPKNQPENKEDDAVEVKRTVTVHSIVAKDFLKYFDVKTVVLVDGKEIEAKFEETEMTDYIKELFIIKEHINVCTELKTTFDIMVSTKSYKTVKAITTLKRNSVAFEGTTCGNANMLFCSADGKLHTSDGTSFSSNIADQLDTPEKAEDFFKMITQEVVTKEWQINAIQE